MSWFFTRPIIRFECQTCNRTVSLRIDDLVNGKAQVPKECPGCGNRGSNWIHCRGDDHWIKSSAIPEDWENDICPSCAGEKVDERLLNKNHVFTLPEFSDEKLESRIRCKECGELQRHSIHDVDEDDYEEEDGSADLRDSELQDGWRDEIEDEV